MIPTAEVSEIESTGQTFALGDGGEVVEVWEYFAQNINDFATAKTVVDHFAEFPRHLDNPEVDLLGLFLRAKLTLKRNQVAYAQAQAAVTKAREQSRSLVGITRSFHDFVKNVKAVVALNPAPLMLAVLMAWLAWHR